MTRGVSGQKFLTRGSGRVIKGPLGWGRVGSTYFDNFFGSGTGRVRLQMSGNFGSKIEVLTSSFQNFSNLEG